MTPRSRTIAAGALAVVLLLVAAGPASAALKAIWGPTTLPNGQSAFPVYRELGVQVLQWQLPWAQAAPTRPRHPQDPGDPAYRWPAETNAAVEGAAGAGMSVALMVKATPPWANGGRSISWAPTRAADYASFLTAACRRYPGVRQWMIWGEPNRPENFQPLPPHRPAGPRRYAQLLDAAYGALKRCNHRNVVIGGMTFTFGDVTPVEWVRWMRLPNGRPPRLDLYGHNPFAHRFPRLSDDPAVEGSRDMSDVDTLHDELRSVYARQRPACAAAPKLWLSEFTISSDRGNRAFSFYTTRRGQAQYLTAAFGIARRAPYVGLLGWFGLLDEPASVPSGLTTGLMTGDGAQKPAFRAYRAAPRGRPGTLTTC